MGLGQKQASKYLACNYVSGYIKLCLLFLAKEHLLGAHPKNFLENFINLHD